MTQTIETKEYHTSYQNIKKVQMASTIISLAGLLLAVVTFELDVWYQIVDARINTVESMNDFKEESKLSRWVRWVNLFLTFLNVILISYKNHLKVVWTNTFFNKLLRKEQINDNSMYYHFSLEIIGEENVNTDI